MIYLLYYIYNTSASILVKMSDYSGHLAFSKMNVRQYPDYCLKEHEFFFLLPYGSRNMTTS